MKLNVSQKIIYSELIIAAVILTTLVPYILVSMYYSPLQLFHYVNITLFILAPLGFATLFYFTDRWECRPIEMLSFYLERRLEPPEDVIAGAKIRTLNLPVLHATSVFARYELIVALDCLYMGTIGGLPPKENLLLGFYAAAGIAVFPIFSFFLTERLLYPVRHILAEKTKKVYIDPSRIIKINTRTRLLSILITAVIMPLLALGALVYRRVGTELTRTLGNVPQVHAMMSHLSDLILIMTIAAIILTTGIGILLATSISNPLGRIVKVIRELEKGNLQARVNLISNDEIGVLSQSFDTMAHEIEKGRSDLENLNRNLEFRVAEKTENLTKAYERLKASNQKLAVANRELEEANRKLKELDKLKSDFVSIVSHELRTPLTSIKAFAELILIKPHMPSGKLFKLLNIINSESDRLARLINEVLDITKIEAGKLTWHIVQLSMDEVIRNSVASIQSLAENKSLSTTLSIASDLPPAQGDKDRLVQVITNILSNAIKFTPPGGSISIRAFHEPLPRPRIVVKISDTGVGISSEDIGLIFEKFRRSGSVRLSDNEGSGLGLAISRQIIEAHGGTISATSNVGAGSTFTFTLPLDKEWNIDDKDHPAQFSKSVRNHNGK